MKQWSPVKGLLARYIRMAECDARGAVVYIVPLGAFSGGGFVAGPEDLRDKMTVSGGVRIVKQAPPA